MRCQANTGCARSYAQLAPDGIALVKRVKSGGPEVARAAAEELLRAALGPPITSGWQPGAEAVFMRTGKTAVLDAALAAKLGRKVHKLQARVRGVQTRKAVMRMKTAAALLMAVMRLRRRIKRMRAAKAAAAATRISTRIRAVLARWRYRKAKAAVGAAQRVTRGGLARLRLRRAAAVRRRGAAATAISRIARGRAARRVGARLRAERARSQAATAIARIARGRRARALRARVLRAVRKIQAYFRARSVRVRHLHIVEGREKWRKLLLPTEAVVLQVRVRGGARCSRP